MAHLDTRWAGLFGIDKERERDMARCTAPVRGHHSPAAAADCPACGSRYGRYGGGYSSYSYSSPSYSYPSTSDSSSGSSGGSRSSRSSSGARPRWSPVSSSLLYTPAEVLSLTPIRESFEKRV